ncbi:hypothetical protein SDC9_125031 [bioreactor metagenome]|uniref:Uncharacterized protein n=1 Tax=bioreactor metagenome TaxID=1076179 RepID=A0A645CM42_9ZZZZ
MGDLHQVSLGWEEEGHQVDFEHRSLAGKDTTGKHFQSTELHGFDHVPFVTKRSSRIDFDDQSPLRLLLHIVLEHQQGLVPC